MILGAAIDVIISPYRHVIFIINGGFYRKKLSQVLEDVNRLFEMLNY